MSLHSLLTDKCALSPQLVVVSANTTVTDSMDAVLAMPIPASGGLAGHAMTMDLLLNGV